MKRWMVGTLWLGLLVAGRTLADTPEDAAEGPEIALTHRAPAESLPLDRLTGPHADRVREILGNHLLYRRAPIEVFRCEPALVEWCIRNPLLVAEFWRELGLLISEIEPAEDGYQCREGNTSLVRFHLVHNSHNVRIVYCYGEAARPPIPAKLQAEMVLVQRYHYSRAPDGSYFVIQQLESFSTAKGPALKLLMKIARGTTHRLVDQSMEDMSLYFCFIARLMQVRPVWGQTALAQVRERVSRQELDELETILADVAAHTEDEPTLRERIAEYNSSLESDVHMK